MTILGAALLDIEQAVAWIDCEHWQRGQVSGYQAKLVCNPMVGAVGIGAGPGHILTAADDAVRRATSFDKCESKIPEALRTATMKHGADCLEGERSLCVEYLLVGMSERAGRMLIWHFSFDRFFVPSVTTIMLLPPVEGRSTLWKPRRAAEILATAREQIAKLDRPATARLGRGNLTTAIIIRDRIVLDTVRDFAPIYTDQHAIEEQSQCSSTAI